MILQDLSWQDITNTRVEPDQVTPAELSEHLKQEFNYCTVQYL
jgi:hypothetical protein